MSDDRPVDVAWLRERAESYHRDSMEFRRMGDMTMWTAYGAIARELRECAARSDENEVAVDGHKVFVARKHGVIVLEAVNDDRPLVRMIFRLDVKEAAEIANMLGEAIGA